jgi:hypothetical protein
MIRRRPPPSRRGGARPGAAGAEYAGGQRAGQADRADRVSGPCHHDVTPVGARRLADDVGGDGDAGDPLTHPLGQLFLDEVRHLPAPFQAWTSSVSQAAVGRQRRSEGCLW